MKAAIVTIGNELLEGRVLDTNATKISLALSDAGIGVCLRLTVGDGLADIEAALKRCAAEAEVTFVTGGLGPTGDDRTAEAASRALGVPLVMDENIAKRVRAFYSNIGIPFPESALRQAMVLEGCEALENPTGTAPGMLMKRDGGIFVFFPGVPRELSVMLPDAITRVAAAAGVRGAIRRLSVRTFGTGESQLESLIPPELRRSANPTLAFLPGNFEVELRLTASAETPDEAEKLIARARQTLYDSVGEFIYGENDDTLEGVVIGLLEERGLTLACAESCSGGLLVSRLVSVPGASRVLRGAIVAYSTDAKEGVLGVSPATLAAHGAVSEATACEMAARVIEQFGADAGVAVTGNAGPTAGDPSAEVGRLYVAAAFRGEKPKTATRKTLRPRNDVRYISTQIALDLLRRNLLAR